MTQQTDSFLSTDNEFGPFQLVVTTDERVRNALVPICRRAPGFVYQLIPINGHLLAKTTASYSANVGSIRCIREIASIVTNGNWNDWKFYLPAPEWGFRENQKSHVSNVYT